MTSEVEIRLRGISRAFSEGNRSHRVLDRIDADFVRGASVAIRGRSGSGKSTLLNLVGGIDAPDAGQVTVAGIDITGLSERDRTLFRRRHIGFIYQAFNLVPTLSVADNIRLVLELNAVSGDSADERIAELLVAVGLADRADFRRAIRLTREIFAQPAFDPYRGKEVLPGARKWEMIGSRA